MNSVCVLMSTYNGGKFLKEQIDSILNQKSCLITLIVRDDGSSDSTIEILQEYKQKGLLEYIKGKNIGPARSFIELLRIAPSADYYAFSDQDDIWKEKKLINAICQINRTKDENGRILYCSDLTPLVNELPLKDNIIGNRYSTDYKTIVTMCNFVFGCTILMTREAKNLIVMGDSLEVQPMHDWWCAALIGICGSIVFDENSNILYRQHNGNTVGANLALKKRVKSRYDRILGNYDRNFVSIDSMANELLLFQEKSGVIYPDEVKAFLRLVSKYKKSLNNRIRLLFSIHCFFGGFKQGLFRIMLVMLGRL